MTKWYNKNMAKDSIRISRSGVTTTGRIPLYTNSPESQDLDPSLVRYIKGNSLSPLYLSQGDLLADDISEIDGFLVDDSVSTEVDKKSEESEETKTEERERTRVPSLSDISIVSNTVVYDAAGNPSVTLIFKVKNSSGEVLSGMNAKVELI